MSILLSAESATLRAGSLAQFVTVLVIFILVLLITVFVTRWIGNYQKGQGRYGNIEIIDLTLGSLGTQGSFADIMKGIKDRMFDDSDKGATDLQDEQRS